MKTTKRFDTAVTQLYIAFNKGTLDAFDCEACAIGSLVGHGNWLMNGIGKNGELMPKKWSLDNNAYNPPKHKDYTEQELFNIERIFLKTFTEAENYTEGNENGTDKNLQYKGLMAVIEYLAKLDNITIPQITVKQFKAVLA